MRRILVLCLAVVSLSVATAFGAVQTFQVDPAHSQVSFVIPHMGVFKVTGGFSDFVGTIGVDAATGALTEATATIQVASIDTRVVKRDDHLRSADFFDVANHPTMTFQSLTAEGLGEAITVRGVLTIRGVSREITLQGKFVGSATNMMGKKVVGFEARGVIDRRDFGLTWNRALETGGIVVGNDVTIVLEVQAAE